MPSYYKYKLLRVKPNVLDDPDWVALQAAPPQNETFSAGQELTDRSLATSAELVCEFLDVGGAVVPTRGTFNLTVLCAVDRHGPLSGRIITDSIVKSNVMNARPVLIDYIRANDRIGIRLTGIVAPIGVVSMRVLYREMPQ